MQQLTIRMPDDYFVKIQKIAKISGLKKSDVTRMAIKKFIDEYGDGSEIRPYEKVKHLIGKAESGISDLGTNHRKYLIDRIKGER